LYAHEHCKDVRHVWISGSQATIEYLRSKGFEAYHLNSGKAKLLSLRAGAFIYSSYITSICNAAFAGGAFRFNLWHGIPLKKIEHDIYKGPLRYLYHPANFSEWWKRFCTSPALIRRNDAVLTTSPGLVKIFSSAFKLPPHKVYVGQYPRLMPFNWNARQLNTHIENIEGTEMMSVVAKFKEYSEVIVYMPTWRDDNPNFMEEAIPNFELLNKECFNRNILFVFKVHVNTVFAKDLHAYSNLVLLSSSLDMYPLLPYSTALLTDYSSIFFDYTLLNKRIIFYPFDLAKYKANNRELYFDYAAITQGEIIAYSFDDLLNIISTGGDKPVHHSFQKLLHDNFDYAKEINFIRKKTGLMPLHES